MLNRFDSSRLLLNFSEFTVIIKNEWPIEKPATHLRRDTVQGLTVRPEPVEGWAVKPIMVRQA
ncbi:hypothetical protein, partial [Crenothrix sp.]|uniref:hypothetical protein n=1 Tax=Crenothrix sp. TaxID=3100433 RepID=UPI00374C96A8